MTRVLVAEDDAVARDLLCEILRGEGFEVEAVDDGAGAIERAGSGRYDLVLSDVRMERAGGFDVLRAFTDKAPTIPVILITAFGDVTGAMEAIKRGAYDYISKPFIVDELRLTVNRALERRRLQAEAGPDAAARAPTAAIEGKSPRMLEVYKLVARVAPSTATVLVVGESGTGKELVARAIHANSARADKPFVPVNCTALSESLLESELFGHARGAFTGAIVAKRGLFEMADGGTLFLDEIGDMGPKMQAQLLRTLQDGEIRPVGSSDAVATKVDVRLVCATNRDLEDEVRAGRFRDDLYFRINVVTVRLPPLHERASDIPILVNHFLAKIARREARPQASLSPEALEHLGHYTWPGNVRELENAIERAVAVAKGGVVLPSDLPAEVHAGSSPVQPSGIIDDRPTLAELERRYIALVLAECGGNKKKAAERLGIDRRTLYRALERSGEGGDEEEESGDA